MPASVYMLQDGGRALLIDLTGDTPNPNQQFLGPGVLSNSISILGVQGAVSAPHYSVFTPWTKTEIITLFYEYLLQGRMHVKDLVTHRYSPADAPQVYADLVQDRSKAIGVIFDWRKLAAV